MKKTITSFFYEQRVVYLLYLLIVGLAAFTFYLYDLPLMAFADGLLFTLFSILVYTLVAFYRYIRKQRQLTILTENLVQSEAQALFPRPDTQSEVCYQEIIRQLLAETNKERLKGQQAKQEIFDDFGLWMHQIKTPVAALDLLIQTGNSKPQEMKAELFKVNEYLQMMLNYLRQNLDSQDLMIEKLAIDTVVKEVLRKYAFFFSQKNLQLELKQLEGGSVLSDKKWLIFILEQVLFNAIKYTNDGKITITFFENQLDIQDTGMGIRPEDIPRVFEKGYTGYNGREQQRASGLGLYLSQKVAQKIGCRLAIESTIGQGTTVSIFFPKKRPMN